VACPIEGLVGWLGFSGESRKEPTEIDGQDFLQLCTTPVEVSSVNIRGLTLRLRLENEDGLVVVAD
jgi:hypothetical protein